MKRTIVLVSVIMLLVLGTSLLSASGKQESQDLVSTDGPLFEESPQTTALQDGGIEALVSLQNSFRAVAQKVLPVVVEVDVVDIVTQAGRRSSSPLDFFFNQQNQNGDREFRRNGLGSGVLVYRDGNRVYVLTNHHVAGDAEEITITLNDERKFTATVVGSDEKKDLALLVFETRENVPIANFGNSDTLMVGDWVLAIGNPLGFESTVTAGIVSAINRQSHGGAGSTTYTDYIQTDAAINQGNSGGALVNIYGQVIGINTWIASPSGGSIGIGFAIPANNARGVVEDLLTKGRIEYGWLGITVGEASESAREELSIDLASGGFVYGVVEGSPAAKAGILPGDFITKIERKELENSADLTVTVGNIDPGTTVEFELIRDGKQLEFPVTIAVRDEEKIRSSANPIWPGFSVVTLTDELRARLNIGKSVGNVVIGSVDRSSSAETAGLQAGDIIAQIDGEELIDVSDFYRLINRSNLKDVELKLNRRGRELNLGIRR